MVDHPLRRVRLSKNLTLKEVAEAAGIHPSYLSKLERGGAEPSPLVLSRLEAQLGLGLTYQDDNTESLIKEAAIVSEEPSQVDPRNKLNELSGTEWIQETVSVWRQRGLGASHPHTKYERLHPAPFSYQDIARLIRFFTKRGMLILDPFVGVGSTLKAAALEGRRGLGIELSPKWAELTRRRLNEEVPRHSGQQIWCMDIRDAIPKIEDETIDFIVTSPPYWAILNKRADHKTREVRLHNGLDQNYSEDVLDLGNIESYSVFLKTLTDIFCSLASKLRAGAYCVIIVSDFKHGPKFYPFHSDLYCQIDPNKLTLEGITILHQPHKSLYPYGYPFAYVPNIHHQYILIFRRPKKRLSRSDDGKDKAIISKKVHDTLDAVVPEDIEKRAEKLRALSYKKGSMAGRHWGHQRHSLCSFPSKMKPALAHTLVNLFSEPTSMVLDPFSGCGTIPFEASLQERKAIGSDLSPLAYVITAGKLDPPDLNEVEVCLSHLDSVIQENRSHVNIASMEDEILEFYHAKTAKEILIAREFLHGRSNGYQQGRVELFLIACLAHVLHGNRPYALSRRSHNIIPIPPKGPKKYKSVVAAVGEKARRMLSFPLPHEFRIGRSIQARADSIPIEDESIDVVITSPPFLGSTHFLRQNRVRHWLLGWTYEKQEEMRSSFLEHAKGVEPYSPILKELARVVRPKGVMVFHIGIVKTINMADLLAPLFAEAGFREISRVWENVADLETHGRTDRGGTHTHGFVILRKS